MNEIKKIIGNNIYHYRTLKRVKQEVLAKSLNISKARLSQIEHGDCSEITLNRLIQIAEELDVSFFNLVGNNVQSINITNSNNCSGFYGTHHENSKDLILELINLLKSKF